MTHTNEEQPDRTISDFIRNASEEEKRTVYEDVLKKTNEDQQKIMREAEEQNREEAWEKEFDTLLDGMRPKVSNFGNVQNEEAKNKMQYLFDQWWSNADEFYRNPLKSFIRQTLHSHTTSELERVREAVEKMEIPQVNDRNYFEKMGVMKIFRHMTNDPKLNHGIKDGYNLAVKDFLSLLSATIAGNEKNAC